MILHGIRQADLAATCHVGEERAREDLRDRADLEERPRPDRPCVLPGTAREQHAGGAIGAQQPEHDANRPTFIDATLQQGI